jgi:hypothetical protein
MPSMRRVRADKERAMTENHHQIPLLDACTLEDKFILLDWHLRNLWDGGWTTIKEIPQEEHREIHRLRRQSC